eukprot:4643449-Pleurochrysis_carterae.AAC.1
MSKLPHHPKVCSELKCSHSKSVATMMMHRAISPGQKWNGRHTQRKDISYHLYPFVIISILLFSSCESS